MLRAPVSVSQGLIPFNARDEFNQSSGALTGKTLPVGGVWVGAGDADDFSVNSGTHVAERTATADSSVSVSIEAGRVVTASTPTLATAYIEVRASWTGSPPTFAQTPWVGVIARYTDINNFIGFGFDPSGTCRVFKRLASTNSVLFSVQGGAANGSRIGLYVSERGNLVGYVDDRVVLSQYDGDLATGTLASGKVGFFDWWQVSTVSTRSYDGFFAFVPQQDAVLFASQACQLGTNGMFREDSTGVAPGPVSWVERDLPRLPTAGLEARSTEVMIKASRGDFAALPDTGIDDMSVRGFYQPCWLTVPG